MGDKKTGKKVVGIAMAALMIASIFAMIAPASVARDPPPPVQPGDYIVGADNGTFKCLMPAPNITSSAPSSPVTDYSGATRTFNITIDQPVNVSWLINGTVVKGSEKGVTEASYANTSAVVGTWNVSVVVENANGTDMQTWIWNVMAPPVLVNEFLADPSAGDDWVELYNPTGEDISLDGWTIEDGAGNSLDLTGKTVPRNGYLVLNFSNKLNKDGDIIYLNKSLTTVDKVTYGDWNDGNEDDNAPKPGNDQPTGRYPNGVDTNNDSADFRVFNVPTKGAPNTIYPKIIGFAPHTHVSDSEGATRTFNITVDQPVDVTWRINGTQLQTNASVPAYTSCSYTNTSAVAGYWEVTATASNENGSVTQTWWWTVNDTTPPTVTDWTPTGTGVAITTNITATFSEPMNESTLNDETIIVENSTGSAIAGAVTYDSATRTVTFDPTANLKYNETYNVTITTGVADLAGNNIASEFRWNFTTEAEWMPTADNLGVEDATGRSGSYVTVPVNITNVRNGPVQGIRIRVDYNESVLNLTSISEGDLTLNWTHLQLGEDRHTMTIATSYTGDAIPNGSNGSVVLLNFHVLGSPGDKSPMNISLIELSNPYGEVGRTAPARNGTFTVSRLGIIAGRITYACNGTGIAGVVVNLTREGTVINTTVTNDTGYYNFTDIIPGNYTVNASKPGFYDNSTEVTVIAGETATADMMLWLKGDLNNDGSIADAGDVVLMLRASVGDIPGDMRYDLNGNSIIADAGDVVLILRASVRDIELL